MSLAIESKPDPKISMLTCYAPQIGTLTTPSQQIYHTIPNHILSSKDSAKANDKGISFLKRDALFCDEFGMLKPMLKQPVTFCRR